MTLPNTKSPDAAGDSSDADLTSAPLTAESRAAPRDHISLKWGTLKSWKLCSEKGHELLGRYHDLGASMSAAMQADSDEQKELICQMIDECDAPTIYLDWDGIDVSKDEAKKYVREYPKRGQLA